MERPHKECLKVGERTVKVDAEGDDTDVSLARLGDVEGETGHEEEERHEGEGREEEGATTERCGRSAVSSELAGRMNDSNALSMVQTAGAAKTQLRVPKPSDAPRALISLKPA